MMPLADLWTALALLLSLLLLLLFLSGRAVAHGQLLAFGVLVYGVLPFVAYASDLYAGGPGEGLWRNAFEGLARESESALLLLALLGFAYALGTLLARPSPPWRAFEGSLSPSLLLVSWWALLLLWLVFAYRARELIGGGYLLDYQPELMGPLATVNLTLLLLLLNLQQHRQSPLLARAFLLLLLFNSALLLSMGGRLYVLAPLVGLSMQMLNRPSLRRPLARAVGLSSVLVGALLLGLVGLWRVQAEIDLLALGQILLAEPLLTSLSLASLVNCHPFDVLAQPDNFISSLLNFVPSALWPSKEQFMVPLDPGGQCLFSPFGATHLGAGLLVNFGWAGAAIVCFAFAYGLQRLRDAAAQNWLYCYLCSLLPFMLFRDGFLIFNKAFIASGLLTAALLLCVSRLTARRA